MSPVSKFCAISPFESAENQLLEELLAAHEAYNQCLEQDRPATRRRLENAVRKHLEFCALSGRENCDRPAKPRSPGQRAALTRKLRAAAHKAALIRKLRAAGENAAVTRRRRAARKAADGRKKNSG
jgi:hypothetical protein